MQNRQRPCFVYNSPITQQRGGSGSFVNGPFFNGRLRFSLTALWTFILCICILRFYVSFWSPRFQVFGRETLDFYKTSFYRLNKVIERETKMVDASVENLAPVGAWLPALKSLGGKPLLTQQLISDVLGAPTVFNFQELLDLPSIHQVRFYLFGHRSLFHAKLYDASTVDGGRVTRGSRAQTSPRHLLLRDMGRLGGCVFLS